IKRVGKVIELSNAVSLSPVQGNLGIAHTRWATHGKPTETNAHPHISGEKVAIVHNGIIENYESLRDMLRSEGYTFVTETDSEVIAHLVHKEIQLAGDFRGGFTAAIRLLEGAYAVGVLHRDYPETIMAARAGSPLVVGVGIGENYIASDPLALRPVTDRFIFLEEGEMVEINADEVSIFGVQGDVIDSRTVTLDDRSDKADKGDFKHFMFKEIFEQPEAVRRTLEGRVSDRHALTAAFGTEAKELFEKVQAVQIVACGTAHYATLVAKYWMEAIAGIPCQVEIASEFRYRETVVLPGTLMVTLSQSGETADTLAALKGATHENYLGSLCICNVPNSSLVRESDRSLMIEAGPEIGVASTKAFVNQLCDLLLLVIAIAKTRGLSEEEEQELVQALRQVPEQIAQCLSLDERILKLSEEFVDKHHALFLGRGTHYPVALEGALKLKEISYIHAEGYAAGELKHGPLALVDEDMPVIAVAPDNELIEKLKSNLTEVKSRGARLYIFVDEGVPFEEDEDTVILRVPRSHPVTSPIIHTVPLQLLSYHVAVLKGTDVDQPRNLAKSVTVE
ncbi:MAG: glutamine--fructose-6-phosphate transaminase (isomerizing), partial [Gammaproteobacteria bacterium]|nr:glutamine--fructose-6-phosphate transaminase (isomerizing) [Gammaproteobacteria bacterium]